jgi:hypothetical protein
MHNEPCPYYNFTGNKVQSEVEAYQVLQENGVPVPQLLDYSYDGQYLVKEYLDAPCGHEWVAGGQQSETIIRELFMISGRLREKGINIDYFPTNFVITGDGLFYVDYEINPYQLMWSLEEWGIYYWANCAGMAEYMRSGDWRGINQCADSGIPIKAPFEAQVNIWKRKYSTLL